MFFFYILKPLSTHFCNQSSALEDDEGFKAKNGGKNYETKRNSKFKSFARAQDDNDF